CRSAYICTSVYTDSDRCPRAIHCAVQMPFRSHTPAHHLAAAGAPGAVRVRTVRCTAARPVEDLPTPGAAARLRAADRPAPGPVGLLPPASATAGLVADGA